MIILLIIRLLWGPLWHCQTQHKMVQFKKLCRYKWPSEDLFPNEGRNICLVCQSWPPASSCRQGSRWSALSSGHPQRIWHDYRCTSQGPSTFTVCTDALKALNPNHKKAAGVVSHEGEAKAIYYV